MIIYYQTKFGSSSEEVETVTFWSYAPCCDLDLKNSKSVFLHALWFMKMHHNSKFGNKMFGSLEDIIWTNIDILTLHCDLDLESSYPFFFILQDTLAYGDVSSE